MKQPTEKSIAKKYSYMELPPFESNTGWNNLISNLCEALSLIDKKKEIRVLQIKEKFSGLRFYYAPYKKKFSNIVAKFEKVSEKTCEVCGEEGHIRKLKEAYWYKTLCDKHSKKLGYIDIPKE